MAREMILDGGLVPKNLDKNYIVPEKKNMSRSNSRKRCVKPSPPKFVPRHNQYSNMKKREALLEKQIKEQKVLDECTFSPNIDKNQNHRFVRDADQFYRDQQEFQIKKIEKICQLDKEILEREGTEYRPFLSKVSEEIAMKRDLKEKNIHKRLYNESNNKKIKEGIDVLLSMKKNAKSKKETNVHKGARTSRIEEYLYNDAVIRQRSKNKNSASKSGKRANSKYTSSKSEQYAHNKLLKDFKIAWDYIMKETRSSLVNNSSTMNTSNETSEDRINLISTAYLLTMLGYLSKKGTEDSQEKNLFYDLWTLLRGEDSLGITFKALKNILLMINGFSKGEELDYDNTDENSDIVYIRIGNIMNEDFTDVVASKKQANMIQKLFKQLCLNRIQNRPIGEIFKSQTLFKDECIFQPQLNEYSKELALRHRKSTNSLGLKIYESMTEKMKRTNEWKAVQQKLKEQDMMRECTFTPEIKSFLSFDHNKCDTLNQNEKSLLNDRSTEHFKRNYELKNKSYIEINNQKVESVEDPKTEMKTSTVARSTKARNSSKRSIDSNVKRMREANQEKELVQVMMEKGVSRKIANKILSSEVDTSLGSLADKSFKSNEVKTPYDYKRNTYKSNANAPITQSNTKYNTQSLITSESKYIDRSESREMCNIKSPEPNDDFSDTQGIKSSFQHLDKHLSEFYKEKLSEDNVSSQDKEEASITPEKYPQRENYRSLFSHKSEDEGFQNFTSKNEINNYEGLYNDRGFKSPDFNKLPSDEKQKTEVREEATNIQREPTFGENSNRYLRHLGDVAELQQLNDNYEFKKQDVPKPNPLLFVDVNLGPDRTERIIVYENDTAVQLAEKFAKQHNLNNLMKQKLVELLGLEISGILERIDEENSENCSEDF